MRVAVIGAGAVGGTLAALLHRAGHEVEVTARGTHLAAIRERGIRLSGAWGEHTALVEAGPTLTRPPEIALVTTKAQDAPAAVRENAAMLAGLPVVIVQNGLAPLSEVRRAIPESSLVGALALFAASYLSPGDIEVTAGGSIHLGADAAADSAATTLAAALLGEVMPVSVTDAFADAQWTKLFINQVNALPAITGLSVQEVIADPGLRRIMVAGMRETVDVALASGITFAPMQGLTHAGLRLFRAAPHALAQLIPLAMARRMGPVPNPGSTLQSIRRGQLTEIDHLNGAVASAALAVNRSAPVNDALVTLVHEVEETGEFIPAREVVRRIRRAPRLR